MTEHHPGEGATTSSEPDPSARSLISASGAAMACGLLAGYGAFAYIAGRFLYPSGGAKKAWLYVTVLADFGVGQSLLYRTPSGEEVNITRSGPGERVEDFKALSAICPHLGCHVHWQSNHNRYYCPCHDGTFDPEGVATGGPPGQAGQSLSSYPLRVRGGLLFIEVATSKLAAAGEIIDQPFGPDGPGHDPCLQKRPATRSC